MPRAKLYERIRSRRIDLGLSQDQLAKRIGVTRTSIQNWEKPPGHGGTPPHRKHVPALLRALQIDASQVDLDQLMGVASLLSLTTFTMVPLVSLKDLRPDNIEQVLSKTGDFVNLDERLEDAFAVAVLDDSMAPDYSPGDIVVVRRSLFPQERDIVIFAAQNGLSMLRRYHLRGTAKSGETVYDLVPANPEFTTDTINSSSQGRIVGVAVEHRKKLRRDP